MAHSDAELIKRTLAGDETAFGFLVDKYKGAVHALAYRKLGDFHIAEEITQDTFLKAYQKLGTLKDPARFSGWIYVIAARRCISWQRRHRLPYSFDATESEVLVEIMKAPIFEMPLPKQAITAQRDLSSTGDTGNGNQSNGSALAFAANSRKGEDAKATGWTQTNGPYGGTVLTLLATSEGTLYAGTQGAGIFRSTDGGDSWTPVNTGLPVYEDNRIPTIFSLTMMGEALYAGTGGDLFQSTDGGNSWQQVTRSKNTGVDAVAAVGNTLYIGRSQDGVFRSTDGGESWTPINEGLANLRIRELAVMGTTLFAGTRGGAFRLRAGENSWTPINAGLTAQPINREVINKSMIESGLNPLPMSKFPSGLRVDSFAVMENTLYMGVYMGKDKGLFRSVDEGDSWTRITAGSMKHTVEALAVSGTTLYAGTFGSGVFRSTDGGNAWIQVNKGLTDLVIHSLLAASEKIVYAGTGGGGIFRSTDGEDSWAEVNTGLTNTYVRSLVFLGKTLYASTGNGIVRPVDGGNSWTVVNAGLPDIGAAALAVSRTTLYAGTCYPHTGIFRLANDGGSWEAVNTKLYTADTKWHTVDSLLIMGKTFYVGTQGAGLQGDGLYRWEEGDDLWTSLGLANEDIASLGASGTTLYAGTRRGSIFRSGDSGNTWKQIYEGLTDSSIEDLVFVGATLYAGTWGDGVFRSTDGGDSWTQINAGLTDTTVLSFAVKGKTLYAGTYYHGVFRLEQGDDTWQPVGSMHRNVRSLAASETTLYAGTGENGVFRISLGK